MGKQTLYSFFPALAALLAACVSAGSNAQTGAPDPKEIAFHERMATVHKQTADCLKTNKDKASCYAEMRRACAEGGGWCGGMMGDGDKGPGRGMGMRGGPHGPMMGTCPTHAQGMPMCPWVEAPAPSPAPKK